MGQEIQGEVQAQEGEQPVQVQGEEAYVQQPEGGMEGEPVMGEEMPLDAQAVPGQEVQGMPSVQGEPIGAQVQLVPGATVSVEDRTGEVLASNPTNNIIVVKIDNRENVY